MPRTQHWTEQSVKAFAHWTAFDFIAQVEKRMEVDGISQADLAQRLNVTEGSVSHVLNNPQNLTLKTVAKYARVLGMKVALVAYDDGDPENSKGPIISEIFVTCWQRAGRPHDVFSIDLLC